MLRLLCYRWKSWRLYYSGSFQSIAKSQSRPSVWSWALSDCIERFGKVNQHQEHYAIFVNQVSYINRNVLQLLPLRKPHCSELKKLCSRRKLLICWAISFSSTFDRKGKMFMFQNMNITIINIIYIFHRLNVWIK